MLRLIPLALGILLSLGSGAAYLVHAIPRHTAILIGAIGIGLVCLHNALKAFGSQR